jgi:hypothetical protein
MCTYFTFILFTKGMSSHLEFENETNKMLTTTEDAFLTSTEVGLHRNTLTILRLSDRSYQRQSSNLCENQYDLHYVQVFLLSYHLIRKLVVWIKPEMHLRWSSTFCLFRSQIQDDCYPSFVFWLKNLLPQKQHLWYPMKCLKYCFKYF